MFLSFVVACVLVRDVCEVVAVHYVDAVVAVTVMRVLLFVLHVCMLRECEGARVTAMLVWRGVRCCCDERRECGWYCV